MQNATAILYCPHCQSLNLESYKFCQQCRTRLPKYYLWATGQGLKSCRAGDILQGRYLLKSDRVLLDTKPGLPLEDQPTISKAVEPYLKLFPYRLHIPQVYGLVQSGQGPLDEILLLQAPIGNWVPKDSAEAEEHFSGRAAVPFLEAWGHATTLRQLNWLWQVAQLWQPLSSQSVASSLLQPELLRVEGPLVRLLELQLDQGAEPTLAQLGQFWLEQVVGAQPLISGQLAAIATSLEQLCEQMVQGQVRTAEQLTDQLDQWLALAGRSQSYQTEIVTRTDQGPTRHHNEDACYPPAGMVVTNPPQALTIVCDGVGGHAGGAVASSLATEVLQQHLQSIEVEALDPKTLIAELETVACVANDRISQRNDSEQRQERQRMGTTLVMALARGPEMYIAHVGDSRAYWITRTGCYQVTLDDDVASREVRLGYTLYREALAQPASGSLVQALGMGPSTILRPTVQRFILDEDCIFLLCSDGLTDYDRVEESWEAEILPILDGKIDLATASQRLVELANRQNGHDNVTVSLLHCQVALAKAVDRASSKPLSTGFKSPNFATVLLPDPKSEAKTQVQSRHRSVTRPLFAFLLVAGVSGLLTYLLIPQLLRFRPFADSSPVSNRPNPPVSSVPSVVPAPAPTFAVGSQLQINPPGASNPSKPISTVLLNQPDRPEATKGILLTGSLLKVLAKQTLPDQGSWLRVKVCADPLTSPSLGSTTEVPEAASPTPLSEDLPSSPSRTAKRDNRGVSSTRPLPPGTTGWIQEASLTSVATVLNPDRPSSCPASPPS